MEVLASYATTWYALCDFEKDGWNTTTDFVVVTLANFNILEEADADEKCVRAERMTIRAETCDHCDISITQTAVFPLYVNTDPISVESCGGTVPSDGGGEFACPQASFGWYPCQDTRHRCSASPQSTTQYWLE